MPPVALPADAVRPLRQSVLRPNQRLEDLVWAGDDHPLALHAGSLLAGRVVGVATIAPAGHPGSPRPGDWRLRGMATAPGARGAGRGADLLRACLEHARAHGGRRVWCNARVGVRGFYERFGFEAAGEPFELPGVGPHLRMTLNL